MSAHDGGGPQNRPSLLTVRQRSCLLRASRARLAQLQELYDSAHERGNLGELGTAAGEEIACITAAIAWLWLQPTID